MTEIESKLIAITSDYKNKFTDKHFNKNGLSGIAEKFNLLAESIKKLPDELIETANKYLKDNDIDDTSEVEEIIKTQILDFVEFAKKQS